MYNSSNSAYQIWMPWWSGDSRWRGRIEGSSESVAGTGTEKAEAIVRDEEILTHCRYSNGTRQHWMKEKSNRNFINWFRRKHPNWCTKMWMFRDSSRESKSFKVRSIKCLVCSSHLSRSPSTRKRKNNKGKEMRRKLASPKACGTSSLTLSKRVALLKIRKKKGTD